MNTQYFIEILLAVSLEKWSKIDLIGQEKKED